MVTGRGAASCRNSGEGVVAKVARYTVYLVLFAVLGVALLTLLMILAVRLVAYIPGPMWTGYAGISGVCLLLGTFFWRKALKATR